MEMVPLGDSALLLVWPEGRSVEPAAVAAAAGRIRALAEPGIAELVPAYRSVAVFLDLDHLASGKDAEGLYEAVYRLAERLLHLLETAETTAVPASRRHIRLPVVYGGEEGPDLADCARRCGMTSEQFADAHSSVEYAVAMIGFAPGFPYLSGLPEPLAQPRHSTPRMKVPAGSVGIAGLQSGVYPVESPGGWQVIGRTNVRLFRPDAAEPFLVAPGDRLSFIRVHEWETSQETVEPEEAAPNGTADESGIAFEVIQSGLLTTVQDKGRSGWRAYGVSQGGAMDPHAMRTANALVGNPDDAAVLEFTLAGAVLRSERDLLIAVCGADMDTHADGDPLPVNRPVWLRAGTTLFFGRAKSGCRTYLAVAGGFATPPVLGSRSTDTRAGIGGLMGRALRAGDRLPSGRPSRLGNRLAGSLRDMAVGRNHDYDWLSVPWHSESFSAGAVRGSEVELRVMPGAEWEAFGPDARRRLLEEAYRVEASSDRMGIRLSGPPVSLQFPAEMTSHGVTPGTVQMPPDGMPIILGAACQPTGGYPKIAHVIGADLPLLAQCRPGATIRFRLADLEEAWTAWLAVERNFRILKAGIRNKGDRL